MKGKKKPIGIKGDNSVISNKKITNPKVNSCIYELLSMELSKSKLHER